MRNLMLPKHIARDSVSALAGRGGQLREDLEADERRLQSKIREKKQPVD